MKKSEKTGLAVDRNEPGITWTINLYLIFVKYNEDVRNWVIKKLLFCHDLFWDRTLSSNLDCIKELEPDTQIFIQWCK